MTFKVKVKVVSVECDIVCGKDLDSDKNRQEIVGSLQNLDLE